MKECNKFPFLVSKFRLPHLGHISLLNKFVSGSLWETETIYPLLYGNGSDFSTLTSSFATPFLETEDEGEGSDDQNQNSSC